MQDFEPLTALMRHAVVDVMRCNPSEHPILVTEPAWNTTANRERMAEIMFEEFQVTTDKDIKQITQSVPTVPLKVRQETGSYVRKFILNRLS